MEEEQFASGWKPDRDEIITAFADYLDSFKQRSVLDRFRMLKGFQFTTGHLPPGANRIWVKYSFDVPRMQWQANTQAWAHECITKDENANAKFHVPRIYDSFEARINELNYELIVMEFAKAPGPYGGGCVTNFVWGKEEPESPRAYESVEDLQNWINLENKRTRGQAQILLPSAKTLTYGNQSRIRMARTAGEFPWITCPQWPADADPFIRDIHFDIIYPSYLISGTFSVRVGAPLGMLVTHEVMAQWPPPPLPPGLGAYFNGVPGYRRAGPTNPLNPHPYRG
ncbi:hypothetical protein LA080_009968 [Diaporthe eres]|nr:hypothetical protein LA080_009968 [Diaporthe eres]